MSRFWQALVITAASAVLLVLYLQNLLPVLEGEGEELWRAAAPNLLGMALAFLGPVWMVFKWPTAQRPAAILTVLSLALYVAGPVLRVV